MNDSTTPPPFYPPLDTPEQVEFCDTVVALKWVELEQFTFDTVMPMVSGFLELPDEQRLAYYLAHEPLMEFFMAPNTMQTSAVDPATGMPIQGIPAPSLHELNAVYTAKLMADSAKLYKRFGKKWSLTPELEAPIDNVTGMAGVP